MRQRRFVMALALAAASVADLAAAQVFSGTGGSSVPIPTMASTGFSSFSNTQGTASLFDSAAGVTIKDVDNAADNLRSACKTAPATPYTVTGKISLNLGITASSPDNYAGLTWRNAGTGQLMALGELIFPTGGAGAATTAAVYQVNWSNQTSVASGGLGFVEHGYHPIYLQLKNDGTNVTMSTSNDGANFVLLATISLASSYLGASGFTQVCFFSSAHGSALATSLNYYKETSP